MSPAGTATGDLSPMVYVAPASEAIAHALEILLDSLYSRNGLKPPSSDGKQDTTPETAMSHLHVDEEVLDCAWKALRAEATSRTKAIRKIRNTWIPFHYKLPVELQSDILLQSLDPDVADESPIQRLHTLAQVSTGWNALIKASPQLWAFVRLWSPKETKVALRRSASAPLDVRSNRYLGAVAAELWNEYAEIVGTHADRWRSLSHIGWNADDLEPFRPYLKEPLPYLTRLILNSQKGEPGSVAALDLSGAIAIRQLISRGVPISWPSLPTSNLRELTLFSVPVGLQDIFKVLGTSPLLHSLSLSTLGPDFDIPDVLPSRVYVPRLQRIELNFLSSSSHGICTILGTLSSPSVRHLSIKHLATSHLAEQLLQTLIDSLATPDSLLRTVLENPSAASSDVKAEYEPLGKVFGVGDSVGDGLSWFIHEVGWPLACRFLSGLPERGLSLHLKYPHCDTLVVADPRLLRELPSLKDLKIGSALAAKGIIQYLSTPEPDGSSGWPCPNLERVALSFGISSNDDLFKAGETLISLRNQSQTATSTRKLTFHYDVKEESILGDMFS